MPKPTRPVRWRQYLRFWGPNVDADIDDELRYHLEMREKDFRQRGLSPTEAREAARALFGDPSEIAAALRKHDTRLLRQARRTDVFQDLLQDVRYGARQLRNAPRFTIAVVLVLALGIGANTAIFSAVDASFLRPLPFPDPDRLVALSGIDIPFELSAGHSQFEPYLDDVRADSSTFSGVAAYASGGLNLTGGAEPVRVNITYVTRDFFATLGRTPVVGRVPLAEEFVKAGPKTIVLSHSLWQRQFAGDRTVVGRTVSLNDVPYVVTGVMPADFRFPSDVDLWIPLTLPYGFDVMAAFRNFLPSKVIARMAPGVSAAQAAERLDVLRHRFPSGAKDKTPIAKLATPLQQTLIGDRRTSLLVLMASAGLLLLLACANVTNLLLARATQRKRELAVRVVLGATSGRVLRQLLVESVLLAILGSVCALLVARISLSALTAALPPALAGVAPPEIDARVLGFTLLIAMTASVVFGLWPSIGASRPDLGDAMKLGAGATRRRGAGARGVFVVAEVSIALMLLIGAGLMLESLRTLLQVDTGMHADHIVTGRLTLSSAKYPGRAAESAFLADIVDRLSKAPGVEAAAAVSALPMEGAGGIGLRVTPEDAPNDPSRVSGGAYLMATPGFFKVMGVPLLGEDLPSFADTTRPVAVINQSLAHKLWPNGSAIGRRMIFGGNARPRTIVGVIADIRNVRLDVPPTEQMFLPMAEQPQSYASIVVRSAAPESATIAQLRDAVHAIDATQPLYAMRTMDDVINSSVASRRTNTLLLTVFGALALLLATVGVYGVLACGVSERTREIGVRVALGAQPNDVVRLFVRQGALLATAGIVIGLAGAYGLSGIMASILYEVGPRDPRVFVGAPVVLAIVSVLAVLLPALRATRVDALVALRNE